MTFVNRPECKKLCYREAAERFTDYFRENSAMKKCILFFFSAVIFMLSLTACSSSENAPGEASEAVFDVIMSRRSIRQFTDQPVSREILDEILKYGINAPNGQNRQAYEIRVVDDPEFLAGISAAVQADRQGENGRGSKSIFAGAPCVIFLANDTSYDMSQVDCGLLGENIILSAWAMGIGSCCMAAPVRQMKESAACAPYIEKLGFSGGYNLLYSIVLGYPDESPSAKPRKDGMIRFVN